MVSISRRNDGVLTKNMQTKDQNFPKDALQNVT
jgi:hypothetical protein